MSDDGNETIGADPDELASLIEEAARRQGSLPSAPVDATAGSPDRDDTADVAAGLPDGIDDATAGLPDGDDTAEMTAGLLGVTGDADRGKIAPEDPTVPIVDDLTDGSDGDAAVTSAAAVSVPDVEMDEPVGERGDESVEFEDDLTYATIDDAVGYEQEPARLEPKAVASVSDDAKHQASQTAAADFVRESRLRAAEAAQAEQPAQSKKRRSGLWVAVAVILGAQMIAGGVYFALTALRDEPEIVADDVEVVAAEDEIVVPTPEPTPTARAAPAVEGTPTPVPPTPTWRPVADGPRSAPFTFTVEAIVGTPQFFDDRNGDEVEPAVNGRTLPLGNPLLSGQALVLRVVGGEPGDEWAQVQLPGDANSVAWVRGEEFVWSSTTRLIQIDISTNTLTIFDENVTIFQAAIASGSRGGPSPQASTYVIEEVGSLGEDVERRVRFADFGGRAAESDGLGRFGIEQARDSAALMTEAGYTTDGRILLVPNDFAQVADLIEPGVKVEVLGIPAPVPTPTPVRADPTLTGSGSSGGGGPQGCPPATLGSPPNCYRIVERLTKPGQCQGLQVLIDGDCFIFGGDPELDEFGRSCPPTVPTEIDGRCYVRIGPLPQLPAGCPPGAAEVGDECRDPV